MPPSQQPYQSDSHSWLKAEALCAALLEAGSSFDDLVLYQLGTFRRSYRNDVDTVVPDREDNSRLHIELNRDGLYDRLPEGLFHQPKRSSGGTALSQMVGEYRRFRDEEKAARTFFQPLEQEFFRFATAVEQAERDSLWGLQSGRTDALFSKLWDLPEGLPPAALPVLVSIMPWAWHIKGDPGLTARALSMIITKPVTVAERIVREQAGGDGVPELGEGVLGVHTVTGYSFDEASVCWDFSIGDVLPAEIGGFISDEGWGRLLQHFVHTFMPLEIDAAFGYDLAEAVEDEAEKVLGFSFML